MDVLIVIDMQNDFIDGALGTTEALEILPKVENKIKNHSGEIIFTQDTHEENYLETLEGENLPVKHCIRNAPGWEIRETLRNAAPTGKTVEKPTFGSVSLAGLLKADANFHPETDTITLVGVCTDICVISNALLLRATFPNTLIIVDAECCAATSPENHKIALTAMKPCQITVINEQ